MMRSSRRTWSIILGATAVAASAITVSAGATSARRDSSVARLTVIADHLNHPRGVAIGPGGGVFVAEAGTGGTGCTTVTTCLGYTGAVLRWANGRSRRLVSNLVSVGSNPQGSVSGVSGIAVDNTGAVFMATSGWPTCATPAGLPANALGMLGKLSRYTQRLGVVRIADVSGVECSYDYDRRGPRSRPVAVALLGPSHQLILDEAANTLFESNGGQVSMRAVLPRTARGSEPLPRAVAVGPDGAYYVGEYLGRPPKGRARRWESRIWRIVPGQQPTVWARGFNAINGLAFAPDGTLYVTQETIDPANPQEARGAVVKITPQGKRSLIGFGELHFPYGAAVGRDGSLYLSNWSNLTATPPTTGPFAGKTGELVRITDP